MERPGATDGRSKRRPYEQTLLGRSSIVAVRSVYPWEIAGRQPALLALRRLVRARFQPRHCRC